MSDALPLRSPFSRRIARRTWLLPFLWWNKPRRQLALRWCFFMGGFSRAEADWWKIKWWVEVSKMVKHSGLSVENCGSNGGSTMFDCQTIANKCVFGWFQLQTHCKIMTVFTVCYGWPFWFDDLGTFKNGDLRRSTFDQIGTVTELWNSHQVI